MFKKILAMVLSAVMLLGMGTTVFAADTVSVPETEAGKTVTITDMYPAEVPANAVIVCEGETTEVSQSLETTTFSNESAVVEFDYDATLNDMYTHVLQNNTDLSEVQAMEVAEELTKRIQVANELAVNGNNNNRNAEGGTTVVDLGCISDGKLINAPSAKYVPDYKTSIISEGWSVNPHLDKSTLWSRYTIEWNGLDLYKSSDSGSMTFSKDVSTSVGIGFEGSANLTASEAVKFGLKVTASGTVTSTISKGYKLDVAAWTKHVVRPYIYFYVDEYAGTYRYYCYNSSDKRYFYVTESCTAENRYNIEKSIRSWTRVNTAHNPNATSPVPPTDWEW